jgi:hypothetical protein
VASLYVKPAQLLRMRRYSTYGPAHTSIAKIEGALDCAHPLQQIVLHAHTENEVFHPKALLIGEYFRLRVQT